jgi:hypothetical protein
VVNGLILLGFIALIIAVIMARTGRRMGVAVTGRALAMTISGVAIAVLILWATTRG